jgi:hypothetical protein
MHRQDQIQKYGPWILKNWIFDLLDRLKIADDAPQAGLDVPGYGLEIDGLSRGLGHHRGRPHNSHNGRANRGVM